ncbi:MAG TPA: DUF6505 family protein [Arenibaculum sp.]|nr:DUF6505 family protein [Arenibaculum sp.]
MSLRLPRTIRLDASDERIFERAAEPGEWAVSGAFMFLDSRPGELHGKARQAFANGFLGIESFGWSSLVVVARASEAEAETAAATLARHFVECLGAPSPDAALPVARQEISFAASLCDHPVDTLLAVVREWSDDGVREAFRIVEPARTRLHAPVWKIVPDGADGPVSGERRR